MTQIVYTIVIYLFTGAGSFSGSASWEITVIIPEKVVILWSQYILFVRVSELNCSLSWMAIFSLQILFLVLKETFVSFKDEPFEFCGEGWRNLSV